MKLNHGMISIALIFASGMSSSVGASTQPASSMADLKNTKGHVRIELMYELGPEDQRISDASDFQITVASKDKNFSPAQKSCRKMVGVASVYGQGGPEDSPTQKLADGGHLNVKAMTAAMRTEALESWVRVKNNKTGKIVWVKVNDRGPFVKGRIIDLSPAAARALGFDGLASVEVSTCSG